MGIDTLKKIIALLVGISLILTSPCSAAAMPDDQGSSFNVYLPVIQNGLAGYYVSPSGNDQNPGTFSRPWQTIRKAAGMVKPGDTVYVREGTYNEAVTLRISGTEQKPIRLIAYPGETVVVDGNGQLPADWTGLVDLKGDWITVSGFEVRNSAYVGVQLTGQHNRADHIYAHHNQRNGIYARGDYGTIEDSRLWRNAMVNENNKAGNGSSALTTARDDVNGVTDYAILRNNIVWENWGIGIDSYESNGTLIEGNTVHDNLIGNIYISDATNIVCDQNFVYMTPGSITYGVSSNFGILLGDEVYNPISANITIINNIAYGNNLNLMWYSGVQGGGMKDVLIANNTFVDAMANTKGNRNVDVSAGTHENVQITNNIIVQSDSQAIEDITINPQIVLSHNLWSKSPRAAILGATDLIGDPKLQKSGTPFAYPWFELNSGSPAIDRAISLPQVTVDFRSKLRGTAPDVGALEH